MKIAIVGANGFIGRNLLLGLDQSYQLYALDLGSALKNFIETHRLSRIKSASCDLTDPDALAALSLCWGEEFDAVVYLAGNGDPARSVSDPAFDLRHTPLGLINFFSSFRTRHLIYFSSGAVYDGIDGPVGPSTPVNPILPYAIGKYAAERYIHFFSGSGRVGRFNILRFFGAYGPYEPPRKIYTKLVNNFAISKNSEFTIRGDGANLIDAMFVDDTVRGVKAVLEDSSSSGTFDFCMGKPFTLRDLVKAAAHTFGIEPRIIFQGEVPEYITFRPSPVEFSQQFNFKPEISLSDGLGRLAEFIRAASRE